MRTKDATTGRNGSVAAFLFPLILKAVLPPEQCSEVARRLGFELGELNQPGRYLSDPVGARTLWGELLRLTGDPMIGWRAAARVDLSGLGAFMAMLRSARTFGDAIRLAVRFSDVIDSLAHPALVVNDASAQFEWTPIRLGHARQDADFRTHLCIRIARLLVPGFELRELHLPHDCADDDREEYSRDAGCEVFHGKSSKLVSVFDAAYLDCELPQADAAANAAATSEVHALRQRSESAVWLDQLHEAYVATIRAGGQTAGDVAAHLDLSEQKLQRLLRQHQTSHRRELRRARVVMAEYLLSSTRASLGDIAERLGYADRAAFTRAFKQWTGSPPSRFRDSAPAP